MRAVHKCLHECEDDDDTLTGTAATPNAFGARQKAQLSLRSRAMLHVIKHFAKSLKSVLDT